MSNNISVSVIIPNYNHAQFLKQRIDSVLNQTYQDFEVIILDDCSTDSSREIIEQYRNHPKINKIIYNDQNSGGVFKQWVKGIENATGKYIWIAESDDFAAESFLEETKRFIEKNVAVGMVFTNSVAVNSIGDFLTTTADSKREIYMHLASFGNTIDKVNLPHFLISEMVIENVSCVLFRRECLTAIDFDELQKFTNTGDRFVYMGIALENKIAYLPKKLNFMRSHEHNKTKKSFNDGNIHKDRLRVMNYYFEKILHSSSGLDEIASFYKKNYFYFINYCGYQENIQLLKNVKKTKGITNLFYYLVKYYVFFFKKLNVKLRLFRSIYYRILLLQK